MENLKEFDGCLCFRFCVSRLISNAMMKPRVVIARAVNFKCRGMVIKGVVIGGILLDRMKPAKILPTSSRLIGLINSGLFSLMVVEGGKRGCPSSAKKMMRVL